MAEEFRETMFQVAADIFAGCVVLGLALDQVPDEFRAAITDARLNEARVRVAMADAAQFVMMNWDNRRRFDGLKQFYRHADVFIARVGLYEWAFDVYDAFPWLSKLTAIEYDFWSDMRWTGTVLYPQYPVGRYFVDFGHPVAKVAFDWERYEAHEQQLYEEYIKAEGLPRHWCGTCHLSGSRVDNVIGDIQG